MVTGLTGAILVGGDSRRMGRDKLETRLDDKPLVHHVHDVIAPLVDETLFVTREQRRAKVEALAPAGSRVITDILEGRGPLVGLHAALTKATTDRVLLVACDMPRLVPKLLRAMIADAGDVVIARLASGFEPLHAVYSRRCLGPIESVLATGPAPVASFFAEVDVAIWDEARLRRHDPDLRSFGNVNTPEDLATLKQDRRGG